MSDNRETTNSTIIKTLQAKSYVLNTKSRVSNCWRLLGLKEDELVWLANSSEASSTFHEQILLAKVPSDATGHPGIAHGGFIATLLDEALCYGAYPILPHKIGVTASLQVDYVAPTRAEAWILVRSLARCQEGSRKATLEGEVYNIELNQSGLPWETGSVPSVKASQIVVEPKWFDKLASK